MGATLRTWARARAVTVDAGGRVRGVEYVDDQGRVQVQTGRVVVICCNGIGTPRLLLNSTSRLFPNGLANSSGQLGRNFMAHPARYVEGVFDEEMEGSIGPSVNPIMSQAFYETDLSRGFVRGYSLLVYRPFGPLSVAWGDSEPVPWGARHHEVMHRRFRHSAGIAVLAEDLPDEDNRVDLDPNVTDSSGIAAARVTYRFSENTLAMLKHGAGMARKVLEAAGAVQVLDSGNVSIFAHLMGTARMGDDPRRSVVNRWNQAHDVKNLFVVDGSSFTTSAAVNPTCTIGALALRTADAIYDRKEEWV
jgi:choline dehydrogenase-like flavoprotein